MESVLYRELRIELMERAESVADAEVDKNRLRFSVSSETPVMRWGDAEILRHDEGSVRLDRLRNLGCAIVNHDPDQRAAAIMSADIVDKRLVVDVRFGSTQFAQDVKRDVDDGLLRGISVGYRVHVWEVDEEKRTYTATDWEPFEVTFTPIPADASVGVGRTASDAWKSIRSLITTPAAPAAIKPESRMSDPAQPATPANQPQAPAAVPVTPAPVVNDEAVRAAVIKEDREILTLARSVGLEPDAFLGKRKAEAQEMILRALAEKNKTPEPVSAPVSLTVDAADKARDAFTGALAHQAGFRGGDFAAIQKDNPLVGQGIQHAVKRYARLLGIRTEDWSKQDVAFFALGRTEMMSDVGRRSVNITAGSFPSFVMLNAITKITAKGLESGSAASRYKSIVETQRVPDFKQFTIGGLGTANLQQTAEGIAFPELAKTEGAYSSTAKMWGGTLSLSMQALINDDTSSFDRSLRQAGSNADKTIDKRVFQKLLMGTSTAEGTSTWTSNTTSGGTLVYTTQDLMAAARAKLGLVRTAFMNKVGMDSNPLGNPPRFLVVPVTREMEAQGIVGVSGPGLQAGAQQSAVSMEVIASPWLEHSSLTGNSTTSYYLLGDPSNVTGLVLSLITGFESIQVQPYDTGAVAGMNFKLWLPFEADLVNVTNPAGTVIIPGAQQGTT